MFKSPLLCLKARLNCTELCGCSADEDTCENHTYDIENEEDTDSEGEDADDIE